MLIYTDGGCSGNPGPGGWAYIIVDDTRNHGETPDNIIEEKWGVEKNTTNNRMELMAIIAALEALSAHEQNGEIKVFTDSQYLQKGMCEWIHDWKARGWRTAAKTPVKNTDLWQRLDGLAGKFLISWHWVRGHAGNIFNERCDKLTQKAIASVDFS